MIISGQDIPNILEINEIYYNASGNEKYTESMRDFHNLFVKKMLIERTSHKGNILIEYACGKGGDFSKWINAKLDFVFGIDIVIDNLYGWIYGINEELNKIITGEELYDHICKDIEK